MSIYAVYFSPTNGTEKIIRLLASEFGAYEAIDLSRRDLSDSYVFSEDDVCIIGVPSYGGRVPAIALNRMGGFSGNQARVILVAVYGNRDYDDTLLELRDFLNMRQFRPFAAIAAVAEHSIIRKFAAGRPDAEDEAELRGYAKQIMAALERDNHAGELSVPGHYPYKEYKGVPLKPSTNSECNGCGICAATCPVGAILSADPRRTKADGCISCMRCVQICPKQARVLNPVFLELVYLKLKGECAPRKRNELFL